MLLLPTFMMTIDQHLQLLCSQFLASALRPSHVNHASVRAPSGLRADRLSSKSRLSELFMGELAPYLSNNIIEPENYNHVLSSNRPSFVSSSSCH